MAEYSLALARLWNQTRIYLAYRRINLNPQRSMSKRLAERHQSPVVSYARYGRGDGISSRCFSGADTMALIACIECGKEISSKAPSCPHCGAVYEAPLPGRGGSKSSVGFLKLVIGLLITSYVLTYGLNWLAQGKPPHPIRMVTDLLRQVGMPLGNMDCQSVHAEVISVSVAFAARNDGVAIRDIVHISTEAQSPTEVSCVGRATWSTGRNSRIRYSKQFRNGQYWVEFVEIPY